MITGDYIKALPWWVTWVALAALVTAAAGWGYVRGARSVQADWNAATAEQSSVVARVRVAQAQVTERVVTQYVDRVRTVREAGETIVREVPVYVPAQCDADGRLPAGWSGACAPAPVAAAPDRHGIRSPGEDRETGCSQPAPSSTAR